MTTNAVVKISEKSSSKFLHDLAHNRNHRLIYFHREFVHIYLITSDVDYNLMVPVHCYCLQLHNLLQNIYSMSQSSVCSPSECFESANFLNLNQPRNDKQDLEFFAIMGLFFLPVALASIGMLKRKPQKNHIS